MIKNSSSLTTFADQFGRYRFTRLTFGIMLVSDMFSKNLMRYSNLYIFVIADDNQIVGDGRDHDKTMGWLMQISQQENLELNKQALFKSAPESHIF